MKAYSASIEASFSAIAASVAKGDFVPFGVQVRVSTYTDFVVKIYINAQYMKIEESEKLS